MQPSASDVALKLLEAVNLEVDRLLAKAKDGPLEKAESVSLRRYWRIAIAADHDEWLRLHKLDPEKFTDRQLNRLLGRGDDGNGPERKRPKLAAAG